LDREVAEEVRGGEEAESEHVLVVADERDDLDRGDEHAEDAEGATLPHVRNPGVEGRLHLGPRGRSGDSGGAGGHASTLRPAPPRRSGRPRSGERASTERRSGRAPAAPPLSRTGAGS